MKSTLILLLTLISLCAYSQKIQEVSVFDLKQKTHPLDSNAIAAYMYNINENKYDIASRDIFLETVVKQRIKIYTEEGEAYSNFNIYLYKNGGNQEKAMKIKAKTYNLVDGKIEVTKLDKKQIYEEQQSENLKVVKFALPKVKAGSIIEVEYTLKSPFIYSIDKFYFQKYIPSNYSKFVIRLPEYFTLTPVATGFIQLEREDKNYPHPNYSEREFTIYGYDIPPFKEDKYVLNENDYRCGIKYEFHSVSWPNQGTKTFSTDWQSIGKNIMTNGECEKNITRKLKDFDSIVSETKSMDEDQKVQYIYDYVRSNFNWNGRYGLQPETGLKNLSKNNSGNVADINLLLTNLLIKAGIKATPFAIKPRFNGLLNALFPSRTELNYMLVLIDSPFKSYLADATSKETPLGLLPLRAINTSGLLLSRENSRILEYQNPNTYQEQTVGTYKINFDDICLEGEGKTKKNDYASLKYRLELNDLDEDDQDIDATDEEVDQLESEDDDSFEDEDEYEEEEEEIDLREDVFKIDTLNNLGNIYSDIDYQFSEIEYDCIKMIGDQVFIDADFDFGILENPFKEDMRDFPTFFNSQYDIRRIFKLEIPEGYEVESFPEKTIIALPDDKASFVYEIKNLGNALLATYIFKVKSVMILPNEYPNLKAFYDIAMKKKSEKIILKKS